MVALTYLLQGGDEDELGNAADVEVAVMPEEAGWVCPVLMYLLRKCSLPCDEPAMW
jgi:hypothetical protein